MANSFKTTDLVVKAALKMFQFDAPFISTTRDYSKYFGNVSGSSRKTGLSIAVPKPNRFFVEGGKGSLDASYSKQDINEATVDLAVDSYHKVHVEATSIESKLQLDDWMGDIVKPSTEAIVAKVEADHSLIINQVPNAVLAGITGLNLDDAGEALTILRENGAPTSGLKILAPQRLHSSMVSNTSTLFNPTKQVSMQYIRGYMGTANGFDWMVSELLPAFKNGTANDGAFDSATGRTPLGAVSGAVTNGSNSIAVEGIAAGTTIKAGTVVEIVGVNAINPLTFEDNGRVRQFCVAEDVTVVANAATIVLTEKIVDVSGANSQPKTFANAASLPADGVVISFVGEADATYKQAVAYDRDAFIRTFVELVKPEGGQKYAQKREKGVSARTIRDYDKDVDANVYRLDCLSGNAIGRPEFAVRLFQKIG